MINEIFDGGGFAIKTEKGTMAVKTRIADLPSGERIRNVNFLLTERKPRSFYGANLSIENAEKLARHITQSIHAAKLAEQYQIENQLIGEMDGPFIYEAVDLTNDEMYFPVGVWLDLDQAIADITKYDPGDLDEADSSVDGHFLVEIRKRKIGICDTGTLVYTIQWDATWDDSGDPVWSMEQYTPEGLAALNNLDVEIEEALQTSPTIR